MPAVSAHATAGTFNFVVIVIVAHGEAGACRGRSCAFNNVLQAGGQRVAMGQQVDVGFRCLCGEDREKLSHVIAAFEGSRVVIVALTALSPLRKVQQVLDEVCEGDDEVAFNDAGPALDGVRCPEDGVDVVVVVRGPPRRSNPASISASCSRLS